ncbi:MAG: ComF family protein [Candidatus Moraniibacteriota bacterium]
MLFPIRCIGCDTPQAFLCQQCLEHFPRRQRQRCPTCLKKTTPRGETCFDCAHIRALDGLFAAATYRAPLVSAALRTFKYNFIPALATPLGGWLADRVREADVPLPDICIPVPLHSRRLRFRGFNQSALLAQACIDALIPGLDLTIASDCLIRTRYTKPQMKTRTREERLSNLLGAFAIAPKNISLIQGKSVWLIDDVATTGTTLEECARILKNSGAKNVFGIVLAR